MPDYLEKLRPDQDLQCYFERPSAIAALSEATPNSFKVSGTWRQQFDWCVVEWNQHNVYEHPAFRNLPNGDFTGYTLSYEESRENCHLMDSNLFAIVDWPSLRIWSGTASEPQKIGLRDYAAPIAGAWVNPTAELELQGTITAGDYIGISFLEEQYNYQVSAADTLETAVQALATAVVSPRISVTSNGATLVCEYDHTGAPTYSETGANGNRMGLYGFVSGAKTESWSPAWAYFSGGESPSKWRVTIPFDSLPGVTLTDVRKMRWTYAAAMQMGQYVRSEFLVTVADWTVTAPNRRFKIAGPGSRRIENRDSAVVYSGFGWGPGLGNFSNGSIHNTSGEGEELAIAYTCPLPHTLYLGTRYAGNAAQVRVQVDASTALSHNLFIKGEDSLCRLRIGSYGSGNHTVTVRHMGQGSEPGLHYLYFDFLEIAIESEVITEFPESPKITLATDWDTDHSIALPPERTAWILKRLGYTARANHYIGALWYYELVRKGHVYAAATVEFAGTPVFNAGRTTLFLGSDDYPDIEEILHFHRIGESAETVAKAFEFRLNSGYNSVRAEAVGTTLTIWARVMGGAGSHLKMSATTSHSSEFSVTASGDHLVGGVDGEWVTDLTCVPRINRAARDWSRAYYVALKNYGIDVVAAFSMELQHGDTSEAAGIAQRYYNNAPVYLNTPALQTNFSPTSIVFWQQVYLDMAIIMDEVGIVPYLQFGEVQWWYFPKALADPPYTTGMTFYDQYTKDTFQAIYGRPMAAIMSDFDDPSAFPEEVAFLPTLIGQFTDSAIAFVKAAYPAARFEVLYPTDVNDTPLNRLINYPPAHWTPALLDNLKTESFTFTITRDLDKAKMTVDYGATRGFPRTARSFLTGIGDPTTPWLKEVEFALAENLESIVLFALDQYCLVGYATPLPAAMRRASVQG